MKISVVILCAGNGIRFNQDKMLVPLLDVPLFIRTVNQFSKSKYINEIIVVAKKEKLTLFKKLLNEYKLHAKLVPGGIARINSGYNGVKNATGSKVIIHDGAFPLTSIHLIDKVAREIIANEAIMTAINPLTTIKYSPSAIIRKSFPRKKTWIAQTPQAYNREIILEAYSQAITNNYQIPTDDSELVQRLGYKIKIVEGEYTNIKITHINDLYIAEALLRFLQDKLTAVPYYDLFPSFVN